MPDRILAWPLPLPRPRASTGECMSLPLLSRSFNSSHTSPASSAIVIRRMRPKGAGLCGLSFWVGLWLPAAFLAAAEGAVFVRIRRGVLSSRVAPTAWLPLRFLLLLAIPRGASSSNCVGLKKGSSSESDPPALMKPSPGLSAFLGGGTPEKE